MHARQGLIGCLFFVIVFFGGQAHSCGYLDLACHTNRMIDDWLASKSGAVAEGVANELSPIIDRLMTEQLPTIIGDLEQAVSKNIITAEEASKRIITMVSILLDESFALAISRADEFLEGSFKPNVIDAAANHLHRFRSNFFDALNDTLEQNWAILKCERINVFESVDELQIDILTKIDDILTIWPFYERREPMNACHSANDIGPKAANEYDRGEAFAMWQCLKIRSFSVDTPAITIARGFGDIELRARQMICLFEGAPEGRQIYVNDWINAGRRTAIWRRAAQGS